MVSRISEPSTVWFCLVCCLKAFLFLRKRRNFSPCKLPGSINQSFAKKSFHTSFLVRLHLQQMDIIPSPGFEKEVVWMTFWRGSDFFLGSHLLKSKKTWRTFLWFVWVVEPWLLNPIACDRIQNPPQNGWNFWMILDHPKVDSNFQRFFQRF